MGSSRQAAAILGVLLVALSAAGCGATPHAAAPRKPVRTAARKPSAKPQASAAAAAAWPTYHGANTRYGNFPEQPTGGIRLSWNTPLDGAVYAEPIWQGGTAYVATENDTVYALALQTGKVLWRTHLGTPVPLAQLPCGDLSPLGVTGTPVISDGRLYVAAELQPIQHRLFALDLATGKVLSSWSLDLPGAHPAAQQQRGALTALGGTIYVPLGGLYGDCGPYVGQIVAVRPGGRVFGYRVPTAREGAIWAPAGLAVGQDGALYAATGNSASSTVWDGGDSVLRLAPDLTLQGYFAPSNFAYLNAADLDLGSTAPLPLPGGLIFQIGKSGEGYVLSAAQLGGVGHPLARAPICSRAYGGDAYDGTFVYVPCTDGLYALRVSAQGISVAWRYAGYDAGPPTVGGGTVFSVDEGSGALLLLRASTGRLIGRVPLGPVPHFDSPTLAPGLVLVSARDGVRAYALRP